MATVGARGGNILLGRHSDTVFANVYVALQECRQTGSKFRDMGLGIARDVSAKIMQRCGTGDGIAVRFLAEAVAGARRGVDIETETRSWLSSLTTETASWELLEEMAANTSIPKLASEVIRVWKDAGDYGVIAVREGHRLGLEVVEKEDAIFRMWPAERRLMESPGKEILSAIVAVVSYPLLQEKDVIPLLELGSQWAPHPFVIIAPVIAGKALEVISLNRAKGVGEFYGFWTRSMRLHKIPVLEDIAAFSGAEIIHPGIPLSEIDGSWLGTLKRIEIGTEYAFVSGYSEHQERVDKQIHYLESLGGDPSEVDENRGRIANLDGGFRILKIAGSTAEETKWLMREIENWTATLISCVRNGISMPKTPPSYFRRGFILPDKPTPRAVWEIAVESALSGTDMVMSTGAVICSV